MRTIEAAFQTGLAFSRSQLSRIANKDDRTVPLSRRRPSCFWKLNIFTRLFGSVLAEKVILQRYSVTTGTSLRPPTLSTVATDAAVLISSRKISASTAI